MVGLIVAIGDNQHGAARPHRLTGRADTALMNDCTGTPEEGGMRGIGNGDHSSRQFPLGLIARIAPNQ